MNIDRQEAPFFPCTLACTPHIPEIRDPIVRRFKIKIERIAQNIALENELSRNLYMPPSEKMLELNPEKLYGLHPENVI